MLWAAGLGAPILPTRVRVVIEEARQLRIESRLRMHCRRLAGLSVLFCAVGVWIAAGPAEASGSLVATSISAGENHACAIETSGQAVCWGENSQGQLGDGTKADRLTPVAVDGLTDATAISAGQYYTCAIRASGQAVCWGANFHGEFGNGTETPSLTPTPVSGVGDAIAISAGWEHACAIRASGQAVCWGADTIGQLGDGELGPGHLEGKSLTPLAVSGLTDATAISATSVNTCAIRASGESVCWGPGEYGELGDGAETQSYVPIPVSGLGDAVDISTGLGGSSCAVHASGQAICWGRNEGGQLGNGSKDSDPETDRLTPTAVSGLTDATKISVGTDDRACAIEASGQAVCWGENPAGGLGDGTESERLTPVDVSGLADAKAISSGGYFTCAIRDSGQVVCWGDNVEGALGDGTKTNRLIPTPVGEAGIGAPVSTCETEPVLCPPSEPSSPSEPSTGSGTTTSQSITIGPTPLPIVTKKASASGCVGRAGDSYKKAVKAAGHKKGKARAQALKAAKKTKAKRIAACEK